MSNKVEDIANHLSLFLTNITPTTLTDDVREDIMEFVDDIVDEAYLQNIETVRNNYNQAISDVLAAIEDPNKVLSGTMPSGIKVVYKETLKNVIKSLRK